MKGPIIPPDLATMIVIMVNIGGWATSIIVNVWRNSIFRYQHNKMWRKFEKEHGMNGKD